jgi:hypothetical protein
VDLAACAMRQATFEVDLILGGFTLGERHCVDSGVDLGRYDMAGNTRSRSGP